MTFYLLLLNDGASRISNYRPVNGEVRRTRDVPRDWNQLPASWDGDKSVVLPVYNCRKHHLPYKPRTR